MSYSCLERWSTTSPPSKRRLDVEDFILEFLQALKVRKALDFLEALEVLQVFDVFDGWNIGKESKNVHYIWRRFP